MKIYGPGDGTPQLVRRPRGDRPPVVGTDKENPQPPCIVLDTGEWDTARTDIRRAAFDLLREHPDRVRVTVCSRTGATIHTYTQMVRLQEELGISLGAGGRALTNRDPYDANDVLWALAYHAMRREASDVVDSYNWALATQNELYYWDPLNACAHNLEAAYRDASTPKTPPFEPAANLLPAPTASRIATVSSVNYLTAYSDSNAAPHAVGMYLAVPADFPSSCPLHVSPLLCWAEAPGEGGPARYQLARPAATAAEAWRLYDELRNTQLPATLVRPDGPLATSRRAKTKEDDSRPYFVHDCPECVFLGATFKNTRRSDLYFCPLDGRVGSRFGHRSSPGDGPREHHEALPHKATPPHEDLVSAARLALDRGLITEDDLRPREESFERDDEWLDSEFHPRRRLPARTR